jgi:Subtilase family/PEP-CTERM motif
MLRTDRPRLIWATNGIRRTARCGPTGASPKAKFQKTRVQPLIRNITGVWAGILFPLFGLAVDAHAVQLISNGGFETGLTGWAVASSAGSGGSWFADTGRSTPLTGNPTVGPLSGTGYAVTDQVGPGVNALSQNYTVPSGTTSLTLSFDMFMNDWASSAGDETMKVLILGTGGNPVTGAGTLLTLFSGDTVVTGGVPDPYVAYNFAITGFVPGDTYILDYQETDTLFNMNVGVDDVSLNAAVPEPSSVALLLAALVAMGAFGWWRLEAIRRRGKLLLILVASALSSQPVHAQNPNRAHPVMPRATLEPGHARSYAWMVSIVDPSAVVHGPGQTNCGGSPGQNVCYYFPSDINTAYTTSFISNGNGGAGMTVAIVDAYFNSQTEADLANFNSDFGLPACTIASGCLTIVGQTCGAPPAQPPGPPFADSIAGWFTEENLDVQWVHAIAPNAKILLVTANSNSFADLDQAVQCAKTNADVVSDSWGAPEFSSETSLDPEFSSPVPLLFAAGDTFAVTWYPCTSPNVTCVGGTHLLETSISYRNLESVWDEITGGGTGGGCSSFESEPPFQSGFSTCGTQRGAPDIAGIADPYTGVLVYLGSNAGGPGLFIIGGTSLASPVMAAIVANIDASRVAQAKTILGGSATSFNLTSLLYEAAVGPYYHYRVYDVTTGTNATAGWDTATGLGVTLNPALTAYLDSLP